MSKIQYAVITYDGMGSLIQSFYCTVFGDYEKAKAYLNWIWEDWCNDMIADGYELIFEDTYHEDEYAKLSLEDGSYAEFTLIEISEPSEKFIKEYENIGGKRYGIKHE